MFKLSSGWAGKYKFAARAGKYKLGARASNYKFGARGRGQAKGRGPGNTNTQNLTSIWHCKIFQFFDVKYNLVIGITVGCQKND